MRHSFSHSFRHSTRTAVWITVPALGLLSSMVSMGVSLCALSQCQHNEKLFCFFFFFFLHFHFAISSAAFWTSPWGFVRHWFAQNRTESDRIALNLTTLVGQKNFVVASARIAAHRIELNRKRKRNEWHLLLEEEGGSEGGEGFRCESLKGFRYRTRDNVKLIYETPVAGKGCSKQDRSGSGGWERGCQVKVMADRSNVSVVYSIYIQLRI